MLLPLRGVLVYFNRTDRTNSTSQGGWDKVNRTGRKTLVRRADLGSDGALSQLETLAISDGLGEQWQL